MKATARGQIANSSSRCWGQILIGVESALTLVLLVTGSLLLRSWERLETTDLGYRTRGVARLAVTISRQDATDRAAVNAMYDTLREGLGTYPGVERVGLAWPTLPPWDAYRARVRFAGFDPGSSDRGLEVGAHVADSGLFDVLGVRIVAGRNLQSADGPGTRAAVVSRALAQRMGGIDAALDREVTVLADPDPTLPSGAFHIVGVAENVAYDGLGEQDTRRYIRYGDPGDARASRNDVYLSLAEFPSRVVSIGVLTSGPASALLDPLRRRIGAIAPSSAVHWTGTMADELALEYAPSRFYASLVTAFSTSALLLTAVGIFAVVSHTTARRRAEIGLRLALGAAPADIRRLVVAGTFTPLAVGLGTGALVSAVVADVMSVVLYQTSVFDPAAYVGAVTILAAAALAASFTSARRASVLDPMSVFRED